MQYTKKPKMIFFDVGGTLFRDGKCDPAAGFEKLRLAATNPEVTSAEFLASKWDEFINDAGAARSETGIKLETPLTAIIKYATMQTGLVIDIPMTEQEELFDRFNSLRAVIEGVPELLEQLKSLGIRTAVISNNMMSGESLEMAIKRWIPTASFEFCLTSADVLFSKPSEKIFAAATEFAGVSPSDCWYCGDGIIPDVYGAKNAGLSPVFLDTNAKAPLEFRDDGENGRYLAVNSWSALTQYLCETK